MSRCKSCAAGVIWAKTEAGNNMPLDAKPDPDGMFVITKEGVARTPREGDSPKADRFTSHFATCPQADEHRTQK